MNILYKYYRWRLAHAKDADKTKWKLKAYRHSPFVNRPFPGLDLTFYSDSQAMKEELTAKRFDDPRPDSPGYRVSGPGGRYRVGPAKYETDEDGIVHDVSDWRQTQMEWADDYEQNNAHMPTRLTKSGKIIGWKFNKETGRREYITYNNETGKQEKLD